MKPRILVLGRACVFLDMQLSFLPSAGHAIKGKGYTRYPGGSGINTAVALKKLNIDSVLASRIGNDTNGQRLLQYLNAQNVESKYITRDLSAHTGMNLLMTENDGKNRRIIFDGASTNVTVAEVETAFNSSPNAVIVNTDVPPEAVAAALILAKRRDIPVMLNIQGEFADLFPLDIQRHVDMLVIDEENVIKHTNITCDTVEKCLKACISLAGKVIAKTYVIKLANRGSFIYDGSYYNVIPAYDIESFTHNATAECYNATLFIKYLSSGDAKQACELATIAEVMKSLRPHSADNCPTFAEMRDFIRDNDLDASLI